MENLVDLNEYRRKETPERKNGLTRTEKYVLSEIYKNFKEVDDIISRQLGAKEYTGDYFENKEGETLLFEFLPKDQKKDLAMVTLSLHRILNTIKPLIK